MVYVKWFHNKVIYYKVINEDAKNAEKIQRWRDQN